MSKYSGKIAVATRNNFMSKSEMTLIFSKSQINLASTCGMTQNASPSATRLSRFPGMKAPSRKQMSAPNNNSEPIMDDSSVFSRVNKKPLQQ